MVSMAPEDLAITDAELLGSLDLVAEDGRLTNGERRVLTYLANNTRATQQELADAVGISRNTAADYTKALQGKEVLRREGSRKSGIWVALPGEDADE